LVPGGIAAETRQVCENLKAVLEAAGSSLDKVVKVTIYMVALAELMEMNSVFNQYFAAEPPARTTFECVGLVGGARVEIDAIAFLCRLRPRRFGGFGGSAASPPTAIDVAGRSPARLLLHGCVFAAQLRRGAFLALLLAVETRLA